MPKILRPIFYLIPPLATFGCLIPLTAKAQVTADGTTLTTVNQIGNDFTIEQGDRVGDNLDMVQIRVTKQKGIGGGKWEMIFLLGLSMEYHS